MMKMQIMKLFPTLLLFWNKGPSGKKALLGRWSTWGGGSVCEKGLPEMTVLLERWYLWKKDPSGEKILPEEDPSGKRILLEEGLP